LAVLGGLGAVTVLKILQKNDMTIKEGTDNYRQKKPRYQQRCVRDLKTRDVVLGNLRPALVKVLLHAKH